jgi:hypothetical protein
LTQAQLDCAVAGATGESVATIHRLGFGLLPAGRDPEPDPEDLRLVLDCPFCGRPVPYPGRASCGTPALAECDRCDVYFDYEPNEVYAAGPLDGEPVPSDEAD